MLCLKIEKPAPQDCLKVFRRHLVLLYHDEDVQGTGELLERLWLPLVIKMAAGYMDKLHISNQAMFQKLENSGFTFDHIKEFDPNVNVVSLFLNPLIESSDSTFTPCVRMRALVPLSRNFTNIVVSRCSRNEFWIVDRTVIYHEHVTRSIPHPVSGDLYTATIPPSSATWR